MRRNNQVLQIPLVDLRNLIQAEFLQQRVLHILVRKSLGESQERGAKDTRAEEIHDEFKKYSSGTVVRGRQWLPDTPPGPLYCRGPPSRSHFVNGGRDPYQNKGATIQPHPKQDI